MKLLSLLSLLSLLTFLSAFKVAMSQAADSLDIVQEAKGNVVTTSALFKCARERLSDLFRNRPEEFFNLHPWMSPVEISRVEPAEPNDTNITFEYHQTEKVNAVPGLPDIINPTFTVNVTNLVEPTEDGAIVTMTADSTFGRVVLKSVYKLEEVTREAGEIQASESEPAKETFSAVVETLNCIQSPNFLAAKMGLRQAAKARKIMLERLNEMFRVGDGGEAVVPAEEPAASSSKKSRRARLFE